MLRKTRSMSFATYCQTLLLLILMLHAPHIFGQEVEDIQLLEQQLRSLKPGRQQADVLIELSRKLKCTDSQSKLQYIQRSIELSEDIAYTEGLYEACFNRADYYKECTGDHKSALQWYNECLQLGNTLNDTNKLYRAYNKIAACYEGAADYVKALAIYRQMLKLELNKGKTIQVLGNSGVLYQDMGDYANALDMYQKAYSMLYEDMVANPNPSGEDTLTLMGLKYQIANIHYAMSYYERAMQSYTEVEELNRRVQLLGFDVWANMGIADCYLMEKKYPLAIQYYQRAEQVLNTSTEEGNNEYYAKVYNRLGETYYATGQYDSAQYYADKSLKMAMGNGTGRQIRAHLPFIYTTISKIYKSRKQYTAALDYLRKAIDISKEIGATDIQSNAWLELSEVYEKTGRPADALQAYQHHIALRDSIYSRKKLQELTRIDMQGYFDRLQFTDSIKRAEEKAVAGFELQRQRILTYSGFGVVCLLLIFSYFIYRSYKRQKHANKIISEARDAIREEKKVSENLLLNILPEEVADELKQKGRTTARHYDMVTVMFTDFVNFTGASERMGSQELVDELHTCFMAFDEIMDKYDIEKIKTIGDAYLAVSGLPVPGEDHAVKMIKAAQDVMAFMQQHKHEVGNRTFDVRIGIHSGDVVAGIVGVKKFAYDIWGDTVNTAARMEQNSEPGRINISHCTYELVKDHFTCTYRGEIAAKNKGKMMMYFIET